jgi:type VI secretion system protein ImpF
MASIDPNQPLLASVLDRLLDDEPERSVDPPKSRGQYLDELRKAVRRDIEALLNTHRYCLPLPPGLVELDNSLIDYGMANFLGLTAASDEAREEFRGEVEAMIRRYEPRFERVSVTLLQNAQKFERTLRFRVDALMYADPAPEPVSFDSALSPADNRFAVTAADRV